MVHFIIIIRNGCDTILTTVININDPLTEWKKAHAEMFAEIKTRHYPPKILKSYTLWVRKFQFFTKDKDVSGTGFHCEVYMVVPVEMEKLYGTES
ncbi:MAG: hypothetical protein KGJ87_05480 [Planctomycetota bacterium]|nr:hypothetical protein [Planctomycetota bacterium]MDE1890119.1 hypothetical protein [Planctomycetota bacterium]MDE2216600.1 hypothetical protein [Planctomycetota bacterium]